MKHLLLTLGLAAVLATTAHAEGIPEPGIVLYGNVTNANRALRSGNLTLQLAGPGGESLRVTAQLNSSGPHAFKVRIPFESLVGGNTASANTLALGGRTTTVRLVSAVYSTSSTNVFPAVFGLGSAEFSLAASDRALVREVQFRVDAVLPGGSTALARLAEARLQDLSRGPDGTPGTPVFQFTTIAETVRPGILVEWTGAPTDRGYYLLRAASLGATLTEHEVVKWFPASATTSNSFWDTNTVSGQPYFYRLLAP